MINTMLDNIAISKKNDANLGESLSGYYPSSATAVPLAGIKYEFNINEIECTAQFQQLLQVLRLAQPEDEIHLYIASPGGCFMTAVQLCNAIATTNAKSVTGHAEAQVASAATMIFLACNQWVVSPLCQFMFHTSTSGAFGKMPDIMKQIEAHKKHLNLVCHMMYRDFLTEKEIDDIINENSDLYMHADEVLDRLEYKVSVEEKLMEEEDAKAEAMMKKIESVMAEQNVDKGELEQNESESGETIIEYTMDDDDDVILIPEVDMSMTRDDLVLTYKELCEDIKNIDEDFEPELLKSGTTKREIINLFEKIVDEKIINLTDLTDEEVE